MTAREHDDFIQSKGGMERVHRRLGIGTSTAACGNWVRDELYTTFGFSNRSRKYDTSSSSVANDT
jgi:hypothetical protein